MWDTLKFYVCKLFLLGMSSLLLPNGALAQFTPEPWYAFYKDSDAPPQGSSYWSFRKVIDFSSTSKFTERNYKTMPGMNNVQVKYYPIFLGGGCHEVWSDLIVGGGDADPVLWVSGSGGSSWVLLSDDDGGGRKFKARVLEANGTVTFLRVTPFDATVYNPPLVTTDHNNDGIVIWVKRINATSANCRNSSIPYFNGSQVILPGSN